MKPVKALSLFLLFITAQTLAADKSALTCEAAHLDTNKTVPVRVVTAITNQRIATAQWPLGYPTIAINETEFSRLPELSRQFVYYHECAHLVKRIQEEAQTDCVALEMMQEQQRLSRYDIRLLVDELSTALGLSRRWTNLLNCEAFINSPAG